ncbi:tyrosine-type recombinase/integrase [Micromonospora peucetia]|uniref:tyrosine-type recombinase/integrase n=1 Tax=Micromonospora peucetia TaxID=47871 RepID=UPI001C402C67|nr:site-specific integrase [Micromonospora peucetia]
MLEELGFASRFVQGRIPAQPATAATAPRPFGDLATASVDRLREVTAAAWDGPARDCAQRRTQVTAALQYLQTFSGTTWQQRWDASPLGAGTVAASSVISGIEPSQTISPGIKMLFCLRVIQPSLMAFRRNKFRDYPGQFITAQKDALLERYAGQVDEHDARWIHRRKALFDVCCLLTVQGVALADVTPGALLHYTHETRQVRTVLRDGKKDANQFAGIGVWNVLHRMGHFAASTPATMRAAMLRGQLSTAELVDRYPIVHQGVRQLLIDYITRRRAETDYATINNLARSLTHHFWEKIEDLNPGQADLRIDPQTYEVWREQLRTRDDGQPRGNADDILIAVRSFYLDLHTWAAEEPDRWALWIAPCPVAQTEFRGGGQRRRRIEERSADRTRVRQPLLPVLVAHVEQRHQHAKTLLEKATATPENGVFTVAGKTYRRYLSTADRKRARHEQRPVRAVDEATCKVIHVSALEEATFWEWAIVETLRHSGVRIEELTELSHLSIRQYQRANGEVIALLVIAPSKMDRERVIPMSAELFHVIAQVVRRLTRDGQPIAQLSRFDAHDKLWSTPLPYLFQRRRGTSIHVTTPATIGLMLRRLCESIAEHHPAFRGLHITPHDFRRIFATELVNSGLPIHIGAALLGHLNIQTTRGYVAVFDDDVVRHYQQYLQQRRGYRPTEEYRDATVTEWDEFQEHFDKRRVELGSCARPYGTPCQHEHACIRCPMLNVDPKMLGRLAELEEDLLARRARAEAEGWLGEIEGLDLTLRFLADKQQQAVRLQNIASTVGLGMPGLRPPVSEGHT